MKKVLGILIAIILIAAIGGAGYFYILPMFTEQNSTSSEDVVYVQNVDEIVNGFTFTANRYSGVIETQELVKVDSDADKKIKTTFVKEGDIVKTGDKLFEYDIDDMKIQLDQDKLDVAQTEAEIKGYNDQIEALEKEKKTLTSNKQLTVTNQIEGLKLELKKAEYSKESLEKDIQKLEKSIKNCVVKSTVDGTIQSLGDVTSDSYIAIASNGDFRIKAMVNELNVSEFIEGEEMIIRSRVNEKLTWTGKVTSIDTAKPSNTTDDYSGESTTKYPVYISIDDPDGLMIGQHVTVEMNMGDEEEKDGLWLSDYYIIDADGSPYVWAESENRTIEKRSVELGEYDEDFGKYEIKSGITEDDFIAYPEDRITEGMKTTYNSNNTDDINGEVDLDEVNFEEAGIPEDMAEFTEE